MTSKQTSWIYRSQAWVRPRQAGWIFFGSGFLTIILIFFSIYVDNTHYIYSDLAMVMLLLTVLAGIFGLLSWSIDKYIKDEETRIHARYGLHFGVFFYLFIMGLTIVQNVLWK